MSRGRALKPHGAIFAMRLSRLRNHLLNLRKDSAAKIFVVLFGLANVIALGLWVSYQSFRFLDGFIFGSELNAKLVSLLFFSLLILVTLSTILISYATLFLARETEFFFQHPIPPRTILYTKTAEAVSFSGWASLFLCLPVLISFGILKGAPPLYYLAATVILVTFLAFAGLLGAFLTILLAPIIKRFRPKQLLLASFVALVGLSWLFLRSFQFWALDGENNLLILDRFMSGLRTMQSAYSPSHWASTAVLASINGDHGETLFYWALLLANTLIFLPVLSFYGKRRFVTDWLSRQGAPHEPRRTGEAGERHPFPGSNPVAALIWKDLLVFVRSPAQLSQALLFLLLMVIYSLSLLRIPDYITNDRIKLFVHFANLGAVCMILSSFSSRFLFPLLSLEGKAFWILALAPMERNLLLKQKVLFGLAVSLGLGLLTITASNLALKSSPDMFAGAVYALVLAATSLTCLATGLGAAYPSFDEDNPARIASGLGGTLNFFASALVVVSIVVLEGAPYLLFRGSPGSFAILGAHTLSLLFTLAVSTVALRLGGRALARSEF